MFHLTGFIVFESFLECGKLPQLQKPVFEVVDAIQWDKNNNDPMPSHDWSKLKIRPSYLIKKYPYDNLHSYKTHILIFQLSKIINSLLAEEKVVKRSNFPGKVGIVGQRGKK